MGADSTFWETNRTTVITGIVVVALLAALIGIRAVVGGEDDTGLAVDEVGTEQVATAETGDGPQTATGEQPPGAVARTSEEPAAEAASEAGGPAPADAPATAPAEAGTTPTGEQAAPPPPPVTTGTIMPGVTQEEIVVAYYWKGDRTRTSPYLQGSGQEGNVDEAEAFRKLVDYINKYADGGGTIMGYEFNLHGRRIKPVVLEAGQDAESYAATAQQLVEEIKPMAAVAAHGSISAYLCPTLADAGIHNFATYDLGGNLAGKTNGYCTPGSISWERQVDLSQGWLLRQQATSSYNGPESVGQDAERVYGVIYTEYPGLIDSAPVMIDRMKAAGLNIAKVATLNSSLATAQQQAPNVVAQMRSAGVNTIIMPDAGAPLNFTHAAQAQGYSPDYYIWPCSGQDTEGMVRLLNDGQWARAEGLTCYDAEFVSDLTMNSKTRATEWYAAYTEMSGGSEPPAPTPFVYAGLLPVVVGITEAGPQLNLENFRAGLDAFQPYRYDAIEGRTDDGSNMLMNLNLPDRSFMSDVMYLKYDASKQTQGNATPGAYVFPDPKRYQRGSEF